jgi:hypothetical protein
LLDQGIFGVLGKLPIHGRLLPKIVIPVHDSSCFGITAECSKIIYGRTGTHRPPSAFTCQRRVACPPAPTPHPTCDGPWPFGCRGPLVVAHETSKALAHFPNSQYGVPKKGPAGYVRGQWFTLGGRSQQSFQERRGELITPIRRDISAPCSTTLTARSHGTEPIGCNLGAAGYR